MMTEKLATIAEHVKSRLGDAITSSAVAYGELTLTVAAARINDVLAFLRDDAECRFVSFIDITAADYPEREKRFDVVYHLLSPYKNTRVRVKLEAGEGDDVPSALPTFPGANWFEREVYDMYGIVFSGHPDLRRMLTDYGFQGHPLRKDFPTTGYVEVRYDDEAEARGLRAGEAGAGIQQFRLSLPWEGTKYVLPGDEKAKQ
jgi:NADH-quinone oxidoreductase subunit C